MKIMSATEVSRDFAAALDAAAAGETIIVTRAGKRLAIIEPASEGNGAALADVLNRFPVDPDFADDVAAVRNMLTCSE